MIPLPPRPQQLTVNEAFREAQRLDGIGRYAEAQTLCQQILKASPHQADAHHLSGVIAFHAGRNEDAIRHLRQALKLRPDMPEAALNLFLVYRHKGKWRDALAMLEMAHRYWPGRADVVVEIGAVQEQLGNDEQAIAHYERALGIDLRIPVAHLNLGAVLTRLGDVKGAEKHLNEALSLDPSMAKALINLAMLHDVAGRQNEVIPTYDRLLAVQPEHVFGHFQRALASLCQGNLAAGWQEYEWRFRRPESRTLHNEFPYPFWQGESLEGRHLLVWTEQGPGDEVLLASVIPDLLRPGVRLTLVCSPRLVPLFRRSFAGCRVISADRLKPLSDGEERPDFQASFSHLGAALRPTMGSFPMRRSYLTADAGHRQKLRASYSTARPGTKLVGIAWHSANAGAERQKSVGLESWGPILRSPRATFVSLQYGDHGKDVRSAREAFGCDIILDKSVDPLTNIDAFAAQVAAMDHVISVSNTTVHISGALGVPTFTMLPSAYGRIWYWFLDRIDSPWYPAMRLYRQPRNEGWEPTIAGIAEDLKSKLGE